MLKVLHTGDWHIGSFPGPEVGGQNARFQDICRCLDFQAMYAEEHRPDLIVVSGDIFHQARVWSDRGLRESRTAIDHIRRLSNVAPTVVLRGTPNHDSEEQFEMLTTAFYGDDSVSVVTEPEVLHIHTYHGQRVDVACIPGFDRGVHRAAHPGLSREEETQVFTDELAKVVLGLKAQCEPGVTSILSTHFTVPGCNMESGQTALFAQFEPVIYPDTLKAADFDLVALGHIHRPQQLPEAGRAVFYCGSITGLNFNDEGQPRGFYIHDIDDDGETWSEYIETPYREFETIRLNEDDVCTMLSAERVVVPDRLKGKIVRVLYTCSDETNKAFNKAVLEKRLYDGGVFYVSEITPEEITTSVNRDELHGDNSPEQNLAEYLAEKEKSPEDAQRIIELARPIISEAMEKGRLETPTGVFMPVEIEVKNYRNYRDELFSYDGISFATINGENGAGKSSLFTCVITRTSLISVLTLPHEEVLVIILTHRDRLGCVDEIGATEADELVGVVAGLRQDLGRDTGHLELFGRDARNLDAPEQHIEVVVPVEIHVPLLTVRALDFLDVLGQSTAHIKTNRSDAVVVAVVEGDGLGLAETNGQGGNAAGVLVELHKNLLPETGLAACLTSLKGTHESKKIKRPQPYRPDRRGARGPQRRCALHRTHGQSASSNRRGRSRS